MSGPVLSTTLDMSSPEVQARAAYNRAQFMSERRALMDAWAAFLAAPPVSNVIPLLAA